MSNSNLRLFIRLSVSASLVRSLFCNALALFILLCLFSKVSSLKFILELRKLGEAKQMVSDNNDADRDLRVVMRMVVTSSEADIRPK